MISTAVITVGGVVPVIISCYASLVGPGKYMVKEVSNSPQGYEVHLNTDGEGSYDGMPFIGDTMLTKVDYQNQPIQITKALVFSKPPTYVTVTCGEVN